MPMIIDVPRRWRTRLRSPGQEVMARGASEHNLRSVDEAFPLGCLIAVTGVSGSDKSTLVNEILYNAPAKELNGTRIAPGRRTGTTATDLPDQVVHIDQVPLSRSPRSNLAIYTGVFDHVRRLFSETTEAKNRGYQPGRFSFNVKGGRCEACSGDGTIKIEMWYLPDIYATCEACHGARYNTDTLAIRYRSKTIADVLDMPIEEAAGFFEPVPAIHRHLKTLVDVGLGYVRLGQPAPTLSGGEAQRVKLASELQRRSTGRIYVLDDPTTGLHFEDSRNLLGVLGRLVEGGNTVIVIEPNQAVIKTADRVIDLGSDGRSGGGTVLATGTPEQVARDPGLLAVVGAVLLMCAPVLPGFARLLVLPALLLAPGYALLRLLGQATGMRSLSLAVPVSLVLAVCASLVLDVSGILLSPLSLGLLLGAITVLFLAGSYRRQLVAGPLRQHRRTPSGDRGSARRDATFGERR